jgi:hypothetical protein
LTDLRTVVDTFISGLDGETRRVSPDEWGLTVDASGWPLHVGVALRDGLLRAQAEVAGAGQLDEHQLLWWNRQLPLVRFSHGRDRRVHIQVDLPPAAVTPAELDRVLGLLVRAASEARRHARGESGDPA